MSISLDEIAVILPNEKFEVLKPAEQTTKEQIAKGMSIPITAKKKPDGKRRRIFPMWKMRAD